MIAARSTTLMLQYRASLLVRRPAGKIWRKDRRPWALAKFLIRSAWKRYIDPKSQRFSLRTDEKFVDDNNIQAVPAFQSSSEVLFGWSMMMSLSTLYKSDRHCHLRRCRAGRWGALLSNRTSSATAKLLAAWALTSREVYAFTLCDSRTTCRNSFEDCNQVTFSVLRTPAIPINKFEIILRGGCKTANRPKFRLGIDVARAVWARISCLRENIGQDEP